MFLLDGPLKRSVSIAQDQHNDSNESKDENNEGQDFLYQNQLADPEVYAIYSRMTGFKYF